MEWYYIMQPTNQGLVVCFILLLCVRINIPGLLQCECPKQTTFLTTVYYL